MAALLLLGAPVDKRGTEQRNAEADEWQGGAGALQLLRPYAAGGWKVTWDDDAGFAVSVKENLVMGFAFFLYASDEPGSTDCEILYAISAPIDDSYRPQMEEGLHQGLPWAVSAAAGSLGAARSKDQA